MSDPKQPQNPKSTANGSSASGAPAESKAPPAETPEALVSPQQGIPADTRKKLAAAVKCKPEEVLSFREYSDRTIVVVQTSKTV